MSAAVLILGSQRQTHEQQGCCLGQHGGDQTCSTQERGSDSKDSGSNRGYCMLTTGPAGLALGWHDGALQGQGQQSRACGSPACWCSQCAEPAPSELADVGCAIQGTRGLHSLNVNDTAALMPPPQKGH